MAEGQRVGGDGFVSRDKLLALFWPESDDARARNTLSQALHHLRNELGADVIENRGANALGVRRDLLWCDVTAFTDALARDDAELALDMYRGEFCPNLYADGSATLEQWLDERRRYFRAHALAAARGAAERLAKSGDAPGAARAARRALTLHPDDEGDVRVLLGIMEQAGDVAGALLAYQEYARRLAAELDTEPAAETQRLVETMRRRREQAATAGESAPVSTEPATPLLRTSQPRVVPRSRRVLAVVGIAVVVLSGAAAVGLRNWRGTPPAPKTIAVLPFTLQSGASFADLRAGMVDLLSAKLDGATGFRAIDPRSVVAAVAGHDPSTPLSASASQRIARQLGARWYISGAVIEIAGRLQLNGTLVDVNAGADAQPVATASVSGDTAALFDLVDDLAGRILVRLTSGRDTAITRLAAVTTHSLPALKRFLDGERELRAGRDAQAAAAFRDATILDTGFALAQYRLAVTGTWVYARGAEDPAALAAAASRHAQRLTPLARDLVTAYRAYKELRGGEAERLYRGVTEGHPDNVEAWFMLGETLFHYNMWRGRSPMEAWPAFQRVLALDPANAHATIHLARLAAADGLVSELDSLKRRYLSQHPDAERALEMRALDAYSRNDVHARRDIAAAARNADELVVSALIQGAFLFARNMDAARDLADPAVPAVSALSSRELRERYFSELGLAGGQWARSATQIPGLVVNDTWLIELQSMLAADPFFAAPRARLAALRDSLAARQPFPTPAPPGTPTDPRIGRAWQAYLTGLLSVRLGDTAAMTRALATLATPDDGRYRTVAAELGHALRAEVARTRGDYARALDELAHVTFDVTAAGIPMIAHWGVRERFLRAELLHALNRDAEALPLYNSFQGTYDAPYMAATHFRQGEIYQRLGNRERAVFHFTRVVSLWRDADAEFQPIVDKSRRALAALNARR
ncbi:MAG TPA: BTAD domain-containing putative transcriptional regulator [Gemmatimonadaceae bacterium]|nr:BTAD domain-containing putative transcriptional regulator [Gemmatimonadaceae bacterium]